MAGDWIKMRTSLLTNPKVNGIAKILEDSRFVASALSTGFGGKMHEIVTRNVMRHVTVSSLLVIWGAANEHTRDGVFNNSDLEDLDDMTGIPGFGEALESVGWAVYNEENNTVTLPNFNEYNTSGAERSASSKTAAQRQKEYRERKLLQQSDVTRDVTSDVTSNRREEKRREEKKEDITETVPVSKSQTFESWIKTIPVGADAIPQDHHVFTYADSVSLPREYLALQWAYFEKYYTTGNGKAKKYKSWPDHFRTAVESGYGKLWGIGTDGSYYLTTAGKQLQMEVSK